MPEGMSEAKTIPSIASPLSASKGWFRFSTQVVYRELAPILASVDAGLWGYFARVGDKSVATTGISEANPEYETLSLNELEATSCLLATVFLTFLNSGVSGKEAFNF